jgi:flagellar basal-body rod protein FlgF
METTHRPLDVAMQGNAWLAVQAPDGTEGYTRAGALQVDAEGQLVTPAGLPVLGDGGPITVPANAAIDVGSDGTISAQVGNARPQAVGRLKLVTPEDGAPLQRGADGLFRPADGELPADPTARLQSGTLEGSNVSPVQTMVAMISAARQFEGAVIGSRKIAPRAASAAGGVESSWSSGLAPTFPMWGKVKSTSCWA